MNDGSAELRAAAPHQIKINQIHSYVSYNFMGDDGDEDDCDSDCDDDDEIKIKKLRMWTVEAEKSMKELLCTYLKFIKDFISKLFCVKSSLR